MRGSLDLEDIELPAVVATRHLDLQRFDTHIEELSQEIEDHMCLIKLNNTFGVPPHVSCCWGRNQYDQIRHLDALRSELAHSIRVREALIS